MSVRAYKVIKVEKRDSPTFNLWSDEGREIIKLADDDNENYLYFQKDALQEGLEETKDEEVKKILKTMIDECDEFGVEYICY